MIKLKKEKGITLIALVITIIILIILAGITIAALRRDNGVVKKVNEAEFKHELAAIIEENDVNQMMRKYK